MWQTDCLLKTFNHSLDFLRPMSDVMCISCIVCVCVCVYEREIVCVCMCV